MNSRTPYVGLVPYEEKDRDFFCGRDSERKIIATNLMASHLTLFYGESGVGKSSVLNAGVVYDLKNLAEQNFAEHGSPEFAVVAFREWRDDPLIALSKTVHQAVIAAFKGKSVPSPQPSSSLVEILSAYTQPLKIELLIILDQFEEYFLYHGLEDGEGTFADEFQEAVSLADLQVNFLISVREDALAKLDRFKARIPNLFDNCLRIDHLDREAARDAIKQPIAKYKVIYGDQGQPVEIEDGLVEILLEQVKAGEVVLGGKGRGLTGKETSAISIEAPYLQLVMERLWMEELSNGSRKIKLRTLTELRGAENIVRAHLDAAMDALSHEEQETAAEIFDRLVTPSGSKIAYTVSDLSKYSKKPDEQIAKLLEELSKTGVRILRPVPPPAPQMPVRYEIFHDVLAPATLDWRARYVQKQEQTNAKRRALEEAKKQNERAKQFRFWLMVVTVLLIAMTALATWAFWQRKNAANAKVAAQSSDLLANAVLQLSKDADLSTLLAVEAIQKNKHNEKSESVLRKSLLQSHAYTILYGEAPFTHASFSRNGQRIVAASNDGKAIVWEISTGKKLIELSRHTGKVNSAAFSPDPEGQFVVTAGEDGTALVWNVTTGQKIISLNHYSAVNRAVFSPDGKQILTACDDHIARVWNSADGSLTLPLKGHQNSVMAAAYSSDGKLITTASKDRTVRLWNARTGVQLSNFDKHDGTVFSAIFSWNGKMVLTASWPYYAQVWSRKGGNKLTAMTEHDAPITGAAFSPETSKWVVTSSEDGKVRVWETETGIKIGELSGHTSAVTYTEFSSDEKWIVTSSKDKTVRVWNSPTEDNFVELHGQNGLVYNATFSSDGRHVVASSGDKHALLWDITNIDKQPVLLDHKDKVKSASFSQDGKWVLTSSDDWSARVWPVDKVGEPVELKEGRGTVYQAAFSSDGQQILTVSDFDQVVRVWRYSGKWQKLKDMTGEDMKHITNATFSRDGQKIVAASKDGKVIVWEAATGKTLLRLPKNENPVNSVTFSPDSKFILTAADDGTARLWDAVTGQIKNILKHDKKVNTAVFSPANGKWVLTASDDETARIWDVNTGAELHKLFGLGAVIGAIFSPDGKWVATAHKDKVARVWSSGTGEKLIELRQPKINLQSLAFSPDGKRLVIVRNEDKKHSTVWIYGCEVCDSLDKLLTLASSRIKRKLTPEERKRFLLEQ